MIYASIEALAAEHALAVTGVFHPEEGDGLPPSCLTLVLLSPAPNGFWQAFSESPEGGDGLADPVDRWSQRVIGNLADRLGAVPHFPFTGPPYAPFMHWARRSGAAWSSPVQMLCHERYGLMISYRGALAFDAHIALPAVPPEPACESCAQPCVSACPAGAITARNYDVSRCHAYLEANPDAPCLTKGCEVRRACPLSQGAGRLAEQSAYHMGQFHP